jgi:hypothetical protein
MNLPRFSIAWIMAIIVIVAIDFAAIRALSSTGTLVGVLIAIGSIPMAGILMLGIPSLIKGLSGRGKVRPFLNGFEGVGWTILFVYTGSAILFPESIAGQFESVLNSLMKVMGWDAADTSDASWQLFWLFVAILILLLPQSVIALIGGWLNQRFEFRITIKRRRETEFEIQQPVRSMALS